MIDGAKISAKQKGAAGISGTENGHGPKRDTHSEAGWLNVAGLDERGAEWLDRRAVAALLSETVRPSKRTSHGDGEF
jgi:hypothetical protein